MTHLPFNLLTFIVLCFGGIHSAYSRSFYDHSHVMLKSTPTLIHSASSSTRRGRRSNRKPVKEQTLKYFTKDLEDNDHMGDLESEQQGDACLCSYEAPVLRFFQRPINPVMKNLARGAFLRVASDISGGTPLENIKCRVTVTTDKPIQATKNLVSQGGIVSLWSGTQSRTLEGALMGAMFLVGSAATKKQVLQWGGSKTVAALAGGIVGGVVQSVVMTPAGLIFTSLNMNKGKKGYENDTAMTVAKRVIADKGFMGLYAGGGAMALRQASNWASRSMFTEICRTNLKLSRFGLVGEIASGAIGGVGSCWNTPIETVRVLMQRDVALGKPGKPYMGYVQDILDTKGPQGLFVGVTPRAIQAIWQTVFMVVVPNLLGI